MSFAEIKRRSEILSAIREFKRLGRKEFLKTYGFGPAKSYWLLYKGKHYDSKAIVGVARKYARPDLGPMKSNDFTGGEGMARRALTELGFKVEIDNRKKIGIGDSVESPRGFLLTWKDTGWPHSNLVRMEKSFLTDGFVEEAWRLRASNIAQVGDLVWLLRQGPGEKGIFGFGQLVGSPKPSTASDGKRKMQALIRFSKFSDPRKHFLVSESEVRKVLSNSQIRAQASGDPLQAAQVATLQKLVPAASKIIEPDESDDDGFDPKNDKDARKKTARIIAQRRGQRKFRNSLLAAYDQRCAVTGCSILDILEAAHICPYRNDETNKPVNGLLLRSDIHTLFDCGLISVDASTMRVVLSRSLLNSDYKGLKGKRLRKTKSRSQMPDRTALSMHNKEWGFVNLQCAAENDEKH
jgi:putative restriction endonuclease